MLIGNVIPRGNTILPILEMMKMNQNDYLPSPHYPLNW